MNSSFRGSRDSSSRGDRITFTSGGKKVGGSFSSVGAGARGPKSFGHGAGRPSFNDRAPRGDRPSFGSDRDRAPRGDRPAFGDRPRYEGSKPRFERGDRPSFGGGAPRGDRPSFGGDRPRFDRGDRPSFSGGRGGFDRGSRSGDRGGRPSFSGGRGGRGGSRARTYFDVSQYINRNPVAVKEEKAVVTHAFQDFGLNEKLVTIVTDELKYTEPSPIQDQIIPLIMNGQDVIGLSNTGTGKTAAFLLPLIDETLNNPKMQTLILAPTRELATQIQDELRKLTPRMGVFSTVCVGGMPIRRQISQLSKRNHFIVGTPGRILDLIEHGHIYTDRLTHVVLDEADRMLDMGFINDMRKILAGIPEDHQTLFFSATMSKEVERLVNDFLRNPVTISVVKRDTAASIAQDVVPHGHHDKFETLVNLLKDEEKFPRVIIFGEMKHSVERLSNALDDIGIKSTSIHGNKSQQQRDRALKAFKSGQVRILCATDVAARGIHVDNVSHVINYDLPATQEDYVHRIGRTGRAGKGGMALTFVPAAKLS